MSPEIKFHLIVLGTILLLMFLLTVSFLKGKTAQKEKYFHYLLGIKSVTTLILIFVGAMVASTRSGMAFMDWPTSNGLIWPSLEKWIHQRDMFWEHLHRLIAEGLGALAICATIWSYKTFGGRYFKSCLLLLFLIVLQGYFGGLTVKKLTPWWSSTLHGAVAQLIFAFIVVLWYRTGKTGKGLLPTLTADEWLRKFMKVVFVILMVQLLLGASFRHKMKVAQFASAISASLMKEIDEKKYSLTPLKNGEYTIQLKVEKKGEVSISFNGQKFSKSVRAETGEFLAVGHIQLLASESYEFLVEGEFSEIRLIGPDRINYNFQTGEQLPFVIVYKEVMDGNRHLLWSHVAFAVVVIFAVLFLAIYQIKKSEVLPAFRWIGYGLLISLCTQVFLGLVALITVSERQKNVYDQVKTILTSAHLANGAILLSFAVLSIFLYRWSFGKTARVE